ncbi:Ferredoxin-2 [compost metagenome]
MIELVSSERCIGCNLCVKVCPTNVFDRTDHEPVIARQEDCQTCFICEAYCPADALYVTPYTDEVIGVQEEDLAERQLLGSWRATIGWAPGHIKLAARDQTAFIDRILPPRTEKLAGVSDVRGR